MYFAFYEFYLFSVYGLYVSDGFPSFLSCLIQFYVDKVNLIGLEYGLLE